MSKPECGAQGEEWDISVCVFYFFGNVSEVVLECMRRTLAKEKSELRYMLLCMTQRERMKLPQTDLKIKHAFDEWISGNLWLRLNIAF